MPSVKLDKILSFSIDFSFGTTEITTATSFESGYAAIANLQTLVINEDIYNLASAGDDTAVFSFAKVKLDKILSFSGWLIAEDESPNTSLFIRPAFTVLSVAVHLPC